MISNIPKEIIEKHSIGVQAALKYYVENSPTGLSDQDYDALEKAAWEDGLSLRDYATQFLQGQRSQNAGYIGKVEKSQVTGVMSQALLEYRKAHPEIDHWLPKYDGSSLAAYYDPFTGRPLRVVTVGGSNLGGLGVDQSEKFLKYLPDLPGTGVMCLQCECLVALHHGLGEKSRQKANGLVNSSWVPLSPNEFKGGQGTESEYSKYLQDFMENNEKVRTEVDSLITLRCFRYYLSPDSPYTPGIQKLGHEAFLASLPIIYNSFGDIKFCGAFTFRDHLPEYIETDIWNTPTGAFLTDGVVGYTFDGECVRALKYKDAGRGEATEVLGIQWNNQLPKGKDSWSANAIITPVYLRGTKITKPSVGSISKMITSGISPGAKVTIILANSTIPQVSQVMSPGNGDYSWPTCSCGYQIGPGDIFGSLVKCGNPKCTEREDRMRKYLGTLSDSSQIDLGKLLIIDRWDWRKKTNYPEVLKGVIRIVSEGLGEEELRSFLSGHLTTDLLRRNLSLVIHPAYITLSEFIGNGRSN